MEGKIQLTDRQMQLLAQRRNNKQVKSVPMNPPSKPQANDSWADEPVTTAPTTSWESSSAASSSNNSSANPTEQFYGQGLKGKARKLYDDTGASYHESMSSASTAVSKHKLASSTAITEALTKSQSQDTSSSQEEKKETESRGSSSSSKSETESRASSSSSKEKAVETKAKLKKRLMATISEKNEKSTEKPKPKLEKAKKRRSSLGLNRSKTSGLGDDQQRAFLRKMMQSYTTKGKKTKSNDQPDDSGSEVSSKGNHKPRQSWSNRMSGKFSSALSASTGSSTSQDKAIMRKVLERARKKKMSSNPRTQGLIKGSSSRMKKLLSPKNRVPKSRSSDESCNDERSFSEEPRRRTPKGRRTPTSTKKSSRKDTARLEKSGSHADDEAESQTRYLEKPFDRTSSASSTVAETVIENLTENESFGTGTLEVETKNTMVVSMKSKSSGSWDVSSSDKEAPGAVDIKTQMTDVSGLTRKYTRDVTEEETSDSPIESEPTNDETDLPFESIENGNEVQKRSIVSRPNIAKDDEIKIQASLSSTSERFDSIKNAPSIPQVKTNVTTPLHSNHAAPEGYDESRQAARKEFTSYEKQAKESNKDVLELIYSEEPEGYAEFVETLKAEASGSHSQLWESFHSLFRGNNVSPRPLSSRGSCVFDAKTKGMVTNMSSYLKKTYAVECNAGTQLANDHAITPVFGQHALRRTTHRANFSDGSSFDEADSDKENGGGQLFQVASTDSINDGPDSNSFEVTLGQYARKSMGGPTEILAIKSNDSASTSQGSEACVAYDDDSIHKDQVKGGEVATKVPTKTPTKTPTKIPTKAFTTKRNLQPVPPAGSEAPIPWSGVQLRSVMDSSRSDSSGSSIPTSWAKVKLRPVAVNDDKGDTNQTLKSVETDDSSGFRRIVMRKTANEKRKPLPKKEEEMADGATEIIDLTQVPSTQGDTHIDLTNLPIEGTPEAPLDLKDADSKALCASESADSAEGSVLVSLSPEPDSLNPNGLKILVGKKGLMKIESKPGESKARVIWRLDLEEVKSAMLDMASFKVILLLETETENKDLQFESSEQCMKFANALHDVTNATGGEGDGDGFNGDGNDGGETGDDSVFVEQLSEDEQRVLEEFRQKKHRTCGPSDLPTPLLTINPYPSVVNANGASSPLSEVSGATSILTTDESKIAESYQKMLKLQIPKEAVQHKMEKDKVDPKIMGFVLVEPSFAVLDCDDPTSGLTVKEQKVAAVFQRMLKMMIPTDAVRHKMEKEGVDEKIVFAVLGQDKVEQQHVQQAASQLSGAEEQIATSYKRMLKMMIPKEAVEHQMRKDQVDPKIILVVVGGNPDSVLKSKGGALELSDEEESKASSYRKMLSLHIPKEAVRHKMQTEGISQKIIASVLGEKLPSSSVSLGATPSRRQMKPGFHWNPLASGKKLENSIWNKKKSFSDPGVPYEAIDISKHVELFQKKPEGSDASKKAVKTGSENKDMAKLIDLNRANNVAISLKAFKEFSHEELSQVIEFVDPFGKIRGDRALFIRDLLPAAAEVKVIKNYKGDVNRLVPAEKWFRQIVHVKRIEEKIHVLRTMETFKVEAIELGETFKRLANVCNQVMDSKKLPDLLEMVRLIGNRMNEGRGKDAAGFKMDFLPRLAQTKGSDKKTTALDLVVIIFTARNQQEALTLSDDFPECYDASRIQISELLGNVRMLGGAMRKCKKELEALQRENGIPPRPRAKVALDSKSESALSKPASRNNLRSSKTDVSSMHHELFEKRSQFITSILKGCGPNNTDEGQRGGAPSVEEVLKAVQKSNEEEPEAVSPRASLLATFESKKEGSLLQDDYTLQGSIKRIEEFLSEANEVFPQLEAHRDQAIEACKELSEFFCETGGEQAATSLLAILAEFATNMDRAVKKHDGQQKAEARKKASEKKKMEAVAKSVSTEKTSDSASVSTEKTSDSASVQDGSGEKKSLVFMVNEMLRIAGDKAKHDFAKGIVYEEADSRLEEIYKLEQAREAPKSGSPRRDIRHAIEELRQLHGDQDRQVALSELAQTLQKRAALSDTEAAATQAGAEFETVNSLDYSAETSQSSSVASPKKEPAAVVTAPKKFRRLSIADRWTRKVEDDEAFEDVLNLVVGSSRESDNSSIGIEKTDSQILASDSHDSEDKKFEDKKRQQYVNRWANRNDDLSEAASRDLEEESDAGASCEFMNKTRQKYINRWASKPSATEEESVSDLLE
jgi:hypothetical protein